MKQITPAHQSNYIKATTSTQLHQSNCIKATASKQLHQRKVSPNKKRDEQCIVKECVAPTVQFLFSAGKRFQQFLHCVTGCFFWATVQIIQHQTFFEFFERGGSAAVAYTADRSQLPAIFSGANRVQLMLVQRCKTCNERGSGSFAPPPA